MTMVNPAPSPDLLGPARGAECAEAEYAALIEMLLQLEDAHWALPTDCQGWTVRDVVAHITGAAEEAVRLPVQLRHQVRARRRKTGSLVDSLNEQQLADRAGAAPAELFEELVDLAARAPVARAKVPALFRRTRLPADSGALPGDRLGYLLDVIYTRDVWMHRIDLSRATGCALIESGVEDEVVGQVVRDLRRGWSGPDFELELTGPGAGSWRIGPEPVGSIRLDSVAACRLWAGRSDETAAACTGSAESALPALLETRILF